MIVSKGVPQGSVLGPLLFIIYLNELENIVKHSEIRIYADDVKLFKAIKTNDDVKKFQSDITAVETWFIENKLLISEGKSGHLTIGGKTTVLPNDYVIAGANIPHHEEFVDLGFIIDRKLTFNNHILSKVCSKAKKTTGCLRRSFTTRTLDFRLRMYKSHVLPTLDYGTVVWNPTSVTETRRLESIQRTFTKTLPGMADKPYLERCTA